MSQVKVPKGATHYFQRSNGEVAYFLDSKMGVIFCNNGLRYNSDNTWKGTEGVEKMRHILGACKMVKVNMRLENK